jgi:hypothetical protein
MRYWLCGHHSISNLLMDTKENKNVHYLFKKSENECKSQFYLCSMESTTHAVWWCLPKGPELQWLLTVLLHRL